MLKLYKRGRDGVRYWEAWARGAWVVVHEGKLGERGKVKHLEPQQGKTPEQVIALAAEKPRGKGYAEVPTEEQYQVVVQYRLETWGSVEDLDKAQEIEHLFNECLGWTGNGFCDGNDIGSGCLNIFSVVVDPQLAAQAMIAELHKHELLDGAVVAARFGEEYRVFHPPDFEGEFSLL
jgi:hypothetical protein